MMWIFMPFACMANFLIQFLNICGLGPFSEAYSRCHLFDLADFYGLSAEALFCRGLSRLFFRHAFYTARLGLSISEVEVYTLAQRLKHFIDATSP